MCGRSTPDPSYGLADRQAKRSLSGTYLENNLTPYASPRTGSQCWSCWLRKPLFPLENASLYSELSNAAKAFLAEGQRISHARAACGWRRFEWRESPGRRKTYKIYG